MKSFCEKKWKKNVKDKDSLKSYFLFLYHSFTFGDANCTEITHLSSCPCDFPHLSWKSTHYLQETVQFSVQL